MKYILPIYAIFVIVVLIFIQKDIERPHIPSEVGIWAFGEDYQMQSLSDLDDLWNERHGDIFILYGTDRVDNSIEWIKRAYKIKMGKDNGY